MPSMADWPQNPSKLRQRARRYERLLEQEKQKLGAYHDGAGKRHDVPLLYLLAGDLPTALVRFGWLGTTFPDDAYPPECLLGWALALYRSGQSDGAASKLGQAMLSNLYLLPRLLGVERELIPCEIPWDEDGPEYAQELPPAFFELWDKAALAWAREFYESPTFQQAQARLVEIEQELEDLEPGPRRTALCQESFQLQGWKRMVGPKR